MKFSKIGKIVLSLLLITAFVFGYVPTASAAKPGTANPQINYIELASYEDGEFYDQSYPEAINLISDCSSISLYGYCFDDDDVDEVTLHVVDLNGYNFNYTYDFETGGDVTAYPVQLPAGRYRVFFTGDSTIYKDYAVAAFITVSLY